MKIALGLLIALAGSAALAQEMPIDVGAKTCMDNAVKRYYYNNPEQARVGMPSGGNVEVISYFGQKVMARRYSVNIGNVRETCVTSEDGRRILQQPGGR